MQFFPSLIAADVLNLQATIKLLDPYCNGYHIDIMDNHFVPQVTWGAFMVNAIAQITTKQLWVHLMVEHPQTIINQLTIKAGSIISFHYEQKVNHYQVAQAIKEKQWIPSIACNPTTPVEHVLPLLSSINHVLLMSVEPGFSGQLFIAESIQRLDQLADYKKNNNHNLIIAMDGGINETNIALVAQHGCNQVALGSVLFKNKNPQVILDTLRNLIQ